MVMVCGVCFCRGSCHTGHEPRHVSWRSSDGDGPWPGIIVCHDHGGSRWFGYERVSDGPDGPQPLLLSADVCRPMYGGRAVANDLARSGYCVLAHDVFTWGSRRFEPGDLDEWTGMGAVPETVTDPTSFKTYNAAANQRENTVAKWLALRGMNVSGLLAYEDRAAVTVLRTMAECAGQVMILGHSGGAARAVAAAVTDCRVNGVVASCLTTSWPQLIRHRSWLHTWQLWLPGMGDICDYSDVVAAARPVPLWVHYGLQDDGFTPQGMQSAHQRITAHYKRVHASDAYYGHLDDSCGHALPPDVVTQAVRWIADRLAN